MKQSLSLVNQLKRNKAKQIILTILQSGETLGVEEIAMRYPKRQFSMQVASESCLYLYLPAKQFREKFFD